MSICDTVLAEVQGNKMYLDLSDRVHCETLYTRGIWEKDVTAYLMKSLESGIIVVDIENVILVQKAVSNKTGAARLYLDPRHNPGDHRLFDSSDGRVSVAVETTSLDDFFQDKGQIVHIIKMDIQGAEMAALEGMTDIIKRHHDLTLITEFWPDGMKAFGFSPTEFLSTLIGHGFHLYLLNDQTQSLEEIEVEQVMKICKTEIYLVCRKGESI